jgi:hypothetical protein
VKRELDGDDGLTDEERRDPDISLSGYLEWCAAQPSTPAATWRRWRDRGALGRRAFNEEASA